MNTNVQPPTKAIIPAAGWGTRFLPATKSVPKELFPLNHKPILHFALEELQKAGVTEVALVVHPDKKPLYEYFAENQELKQSLVEGNKTQLLENYSSIFKLPKVTFIVQEKRAGLGDAILCCKDFIGNHPFYVLLPDEVFLPNTNQLSPSEELKEAFLKKPNHHHISLLNVPKEDQQHYGIAEVDSENKVTNIFEKPKNNETKSTWALPGRYLFKRQIFDSLEKLKALLSKQDSGDKNLELQLTDAIADQSKGEYKVFSVPARAPRFDAGQPKGYLLAQLELGIRDSDIKNSISHYLDQI